MVILEVHSKCVKVKYKTCLCSKATIFTFLTTTISIIIPFIFAYNSRGFWLKHDTFYEQPHIKFKGEYLFTAITNNLSYPVMCSNFPYFQSFSNFDQCSLVKAREIDNNSDGKMDEFKFSISSELEDYRILSFYLILAVDYSLYTVCPMQMQSAIIVQQHCHSISSSEVNINANLGLIQLSPLQCHPHWKNHQYNYSLIPNTYNLGSYDIKSIIWNYSKRNLSTHLVNSYTTFDPKETDSKLLINLKIRFPEHKINYTPSFWHVIKWAWIQYFAVYIIFAWVLQKIKNYVFENRLVLFYELSPLKKMK